MDATAITELRARTYAESLALRGPYAPQPEPLRLDLDVTCPIDGGPLTIVAKAQSTPLRQSAMLQCGTCRSETQIVIGCDVTLDARFPTAYGRRRRAA